MAHTTIGHSLRGRASLGIPAAVLLAGAGILFSVGTSWALLVSLKTVPVPVPLDLGNYIKNQFAAEQLGKALFWDMQVGSDGVQACATCHFHAGVDNRTTNQLNPKDGQFGNNQLGLPAPAPGAMSVNQTVTSTHFPLHRLANQHAMGEPQNNSGNVVRDTNDVMGSMGVERRQFVDIVPGSPVDDWAPLADPVFAVDGTNIRQVTGRNTPSVVNAVFNFENFHDGRANNIFNGNNPFGPADPRAHLITNALGSLATEVVRLRQSSLASQAVGPPLSDVEMSWVGRSWPKVGKKMLTLKPLAQQQVSIADSRLGFLADTAAPGAVPGVAGVGLNKTYAAMIQDAFWDEFWNNTTENVTFDADGIPSFQPGAPLTTDEYTQMEANFSFFFGLAVQAYVTTLRADDSRFDRFMDGSGFLTNEETIGMNVFIGAQGNCLFCHDGGAMHDIDTILIQGRDPVTDFPIPLDQNPINANEFMLISTGFGIYDNGFHNTGVRPGGNPDPLAPDILFENEDVGRGGTTGLGGGMTEISLSKGMLGLQEFFPTTPLLQTPSLDPLPAHMAGWVPDLPIGFLPTDTTPFAGRVTNFGAFKTPGLRNITLTGPYMHNGGLSTLRQVVDFYVRGGDFAFTNADNFDSTVVPLGKLRDSGAIPGLPTPEQLRDDLVRFMMALTDDRTANEAAPFDHPELFLPITGTAPVTPGSRDLLLADATNFQRLFAIGSAGRGSVGLPPLNTFLGLSARSAALDADADLDLIKDSVDNCPTSANPGQENADGDGLGDACDACPFDPNNDADGDGICGDVDNCPTIANTDQADGDGDGLGDACDTCTDSDGDGFGDPGFAANTCTEDNCPATANAGQEDTDADGVGDACDNCITVSNGPLTPDPNPTDAIAVDQRDTDGDGYGNACDTDLDQSGVTNNGDVGLLKSRFLTADPDADFNGDGVVNNGDVGILKSFFLKAPGPSCCELPLP